MLHVGPHKTGSTTIQTELVKNGYNLGNDGVVTPSWVDLPGPWGGSPLYCGGCKAGANVANYLDWFSTIDGQLSLPLLFNHIGKRAGGPHMPTSGEERDEDHVAVHEAFNSYLRRVAHSNASKRHSCCMHPRLARPTQLCLTPSHPTPHHPSHRTPVVAYFGGCYLQVSSSRPRVLTSQQSAWSGSRRHLLLLLGLARCEQRLSTPRECEQAMLKEFNTTIVVAYRRYHEWIASVHAEIFKCAALSLETYATRSQYGLHMSTTTEMCHGAIGTSPRGTTGCRHGGRGAPLVSCSARSRHPQLAPC